MREILAYPPGVWHAPLGSLFCEKPEDYIYNRLSGRDDRRSMLLADREYLTQLESWILLQKPAGSLVISYEGFCDLEEVALRRMRAWALRQASLVVAIFYCRGPLDYASSAIGQQAQFGIPRGSCPPPVVPYREYIRRLQRVFGGDSLQIRPFRRGEGGWDVLADFFGSIGVAEHEAAWLDRQIQGVLVNRRVSAAAVAVAEGIIAELGNRDVTMTAHHFFWTFGRHLHRIDGPPLRLKPQEIEQVLNQAEPHTTCLENLCGIRFCEQTGDFQEVVSAERLAAEEAAEAVGRRAATAYVESLGCRESACLPDV